MWWPLGPLWIWHPVKALFPHARQGLDYSHCAHYVHNIAKTQYGISLQGLAWAAARMIRLSLGKVSAGSAGSGVCSRRLTKRPKRLRTVWEYLDEPEGVPTLVNSAAEALRWAVGASNRPTSSFVMSGSNAQGRGGMRSTAIRCSHSAVPSITAHWIRCLCGTNSGYGKRQNDRIEAYPIVKTKKSQN